MRRFLASTLTIFFSLSGLTAYAHEFWVEPQNFQVESGAPLIADLRNGQQFKGATLAYFKTQTSRFELITADGTAPVEARMGDIPALNTVAPQDGLLVILHETGTSTLKYTEWEKFTNFVKHKDFVGVLAAHKARSIPETPFTEAYRRFAKALVGVGASAGMDSETGMETEFVALGNPYTDPSEDGLAVRLLYQGEPRADAQIEVFDRAPDKTVAITYLRTDTAGEANIPLVAGHTYLLDAVVLRPMNEAEPFSPDLPVWESLWAALTFAVPE